IKTGNSLLFKKMCQILSELIQFMRVYKFKMVKQLTLLGYSYEDGAVVLELLTFGSNENFYRDAKRLF
ncbi:hypothetical protein DXX94_19110, partial [Thalassotalea euphylliae]